MTAEAEPDPDAPTPVDARPQDVGKRIEQVLSRRLRGATWPLVGRLLRQGRVEVDGRPARRGDVLGPGQQVVVRRGPPRAPGPPQPNRRLPLTVVHEDADLAVVLKPPGRPVHPGPGHGTDTLLNAFVARWPELVALGLARGHGLVHRLDLDTSGLLVVARTAAAYDGLVAAFAARAVEKEYLALVRGRPPAQGAVDAPVDAKPARTRFATEETLALAGGPVSLVRAWPETGRTHQIRLHLAGLGHPLLGDRRHGPGGDDPLAVPRLALHAHRLAFAHPTRGEHLAFEAALPRDLRRPWRRAGGQAPGGAEEAEDPGAGDA